jgi:metallo-beta-lactamase class B
MFRKIAGGGLSSLLVCVALVIFGEAQGNGQRQGGPAAPAAPKPDNPQSLAHIDAARRLAGTDPFLKNPFDFFCIPANTRANNANAPELEPTKIFDNVYALGNSETTVYAVTTTDGILLFDSGYENRVESVVVPGLRKLGLDPANVKLIVLGHGHADHFGGAKYFQDTFSTRIALSAADWDQIWPANPPANQNPNQANQARPRRDVIVAEGRPITLGDLKITVVEIPGHTRGSLAFIFPVKDHGRTRTAGLFGGTILAVDRITTDGLNQYVASIAHYVDTAKKTKVEVEFQNHPIFDGAPDKLARLKAMKSGDTNPYLVGNDRYIRMWNIVSECIQAEIARRPPAGAN